MTGAGAYALGKREEMAQPYCLAMVLCDAVHRDAATGKFTILGTFSTLAVREYPTKVRFCVYYAVTDGLGPTTLRLRLVDAASGIADSAGGKHEKSVFEIRGDFGFDSPLAVVESTVGIETVLPRPGLYHCELWAGNDLLMSRRLMAVAREGEKE